MIKFIKPSFEILTEFSSGGIKELKHIERCARVSYRSENKITEDGESAKKMIGMLIKNGHESCLEHSSLTVEFICDRAIANELVRHRLASFTQESTRYVRANAERLGGEVTFILPYSLQRGYDLFNKLLDLTADDKHYESYICRWPGADTLRSDYVLEQNGLPDGFTEEDWYEMRKFNNYVKVALSSVYRYEDVLEDGSTPEEARWLLPLGLATRIVVTANYREWRHILKLRCEKHSHPEIRRIMIPLYTVFKEKLPIVFDDLKPIVQESLEVQEMDVASILRDYYEGAEDD